MAAFHYVAINSAGKRSKGVLEADTARQVRSQLQARGLSVVTLKPMELSDKTPRRFIRRSKMSAADLSLVTRQLAVLLNAGIPLDEVLLGVSKQNEKPAVKNILLGVRRKVMEGYSLASGLKDFPTSFPKLYRETIAAGERSAKLNLILPRLADYTERQQHIKRKIRQALLYPMLMTFVSICVVIFMLLYIVPKIIDVFNDTHQTLPLATKILMAISHGITKDGLYLLFALCGAGYVFFRSLKRVTFRRAFHQQLLRLPLLGKTLRTVNSARFARTLGILNSASVPILDAMTTAAQLITPLPMQEAVLAAVAQVREGRAIHTALQNTGYFSPMFVHLVGSGELSGQLDSMLEKAAISQETDVEALMDGALTLFEPLMILVMGGIVMFIVLAVMLPIFALDNFNG